jgi:hypothetical protein
MLMVITKAAINRSIIRNRVFLWFSVRVFIMFLL